MLTDEFISRYCTDTGVERTGSEGAYRVYLVSPAAIMSVMPSCDSFGYGPDDDLDSSWQDTFADKRDDNDYSFGTGTGPLVFLAEEGFRTPLCVLTDAGEVDKFHNGNHRLAAAVDLNYAYVPVVFVDREVYADERWEVSEIRGPIDNYPVLIPPPAVSV